MADDEEVLGNPLSIEDEDYAAVHEPALTAVHRAGSLAEARAQARLLVEHGVGATVAEVADPPGFEVRVLPAEAARATGLLGGDPATDPEAEAEGSEARAPIPWKWLIAIWLAALIVLPTLAFLGAYLISR